MATKVINECQKVGLLTETSYKGNQVIALSDKALSMHPSIEFNLRRFRKLVCKLILDIDNKENHDLCRLLAWFLAQNIYTIRSGYDSFNGLLLRQVGGERLGLTNESLYDQFRYWSTFLGFAVAYGSRKARSYSIIPDPTVYLEDHLPALYEDQDKDELPMLQVLPRLTSLCPVLEGGAFYDDISQWLPEKDPEYISTSLSHALLRLQERKVINLRSLPDHSGKVIDDQKRSKVTHIKRIGDKGN